MFTSFRFTPAFRMDRGLPHPFVIPRLDKKGKPIQNGASTSRNSYRPRTKQQILDGVTLQPISIKEIVNEE